MSSTPNPDQSALLARVTTLEVELMHQQRLVEQLNSVVAEQSQQIFRLERVVTKLNEQIKDLKQPAKVETLDLLDEKPPHY